MSNLDFTAHKHLSNGSTDIQKAIELANDKAHRGQFVVCVTHAGDVLVLPVYSATVRDDISEIVYDTDQGYCMYCN